MFKNLLILLTLLVVLGQAVKVQCEHEPNSWRPNIRFALNQREQVVPTIYGLDIVIDRLDGIVSKIIRERGTWEGHFIRAMGKIVREGDVLLNIGAHLGLEMIVLGKQLGPKGKIYFFEPIELTYQMLLKNIYINDLQDITVAYKMGAGNRYARGYSEMDLANTGGSQIKLDPNFKPISNNPDISYHEVVVDRAENVLPKDVPINFALIDPEFMELEVMEGLMGVIDRSPNMIIMIEWWGQYYIKNGFTEKLNKIREMLREVEKRKYKFYYAAFVDGRCDFKFLPQTLQEAMESKVWYSDIFFVPSHIDPNNY